MKNKKEILGIVLSVSICVFVVFAGVYATTSIGDPITVGTDLTVTSGARIGTGTTPGHITALADDSLLIEGDLEVDGTAYFDGIVSISMGSSLRVPTIFGDTNAGQYLRIGDEALTSHSLAADDDLLITGKLEVDGTAHFDGVTDFHGLASVSDANGLMVGGGFMMYGGTASPTQTLFPCPGGGLYFRSGQARTASASFYYCDAGDGWNVVVGLDNDQ